MNEKEAVLKREMLLLAALLAAAGFFRMFFMEMPLDSHEGSIASAVRVIDSGGTLYKDVFDPNPPFPAYLYRLAFELSGNTDTALRIFSYGYFVFTFILIYMAARVVWGRSAAVFSALLYLFMQNNPALGSLNASAQFFGHFPLVLAFLFLFDTDEDYERVNYFLAGFFTAVAALCWYGYAAVFPVAAIAALLFSKKEKALGNTLVCFSGFAFMYLLAVLWSVVQGNTAGFGATFFWTLSHLKYHDWQGYGAVFAANSVLFLQLSLPAAAGAVYGFFYREKDRGNNAATVLSFAFFSVFYYIYILKGVELRYYQGLIPFAALLGGIMLSALFSFVSDKTRNPLAAGILVLAVLAGCAGYAAAVSKPWKYVQKRGYLADEYREVRNASALAGFRKEKDDTLFAWPDMAQAYFYTEIPPHKRHMSAMTYRYFPQENSLMLAPVAEGFYDFIMLRGGTAADFITRLIEGRYTAIYDSGGITVYEKDLRQE